MASLDRPRFRAVFLVVVMLTLFAGDAWRYSISWYGFGVLAVAITVISVILFVRALRRNAWTLGSFPIPLTGFLALATLSIAWSYYRGATALGLLITWMAVAIGASVAVTFTWAEILRALGIALRLILALSLVFEFVVSAFIRHPVLPFWVDYGKTDGLPKLLYWSRDLLFEGGKIQGIVGNSSLLAMVALLGLIVFGVQLATRSVHRVGGWFWVIVAVIGILLTRSATITVALVVLAIVLVAVLLLRRSGRRGGLAVYIGLLAIIAAAVAAAFLFSEKLLAVLGKSPDLTGRLDIWSAVIHLAQERPVAGWGWVSWWVPWVSPFDHLAFEGGVRQLHAHNAWLDIFLQLGVIGLVVFGALVLSTLVRSWQLATDVPQTGPAGPDRFSAITLLPLLLLVALLVQSIAESRLLIEYGLMTLTLIAVKTKFSDRTTIT